MKQKDRFAEALSSSSPVDSLRALVLELAAEGYSKARIIERFEELLSQLQTEPARERDADAVRDVLDFLFGWCSPHMKLLSEEDPFSAASPPRRS